MRLAGLQAGGVISGGVRMDVVHYEVTSRGLAARNIVAEQVQGVALVEPVRDGTGAPAPAPALACFTDVPLLPRCVRAGRAVRTFWYSTEVR